MLADQLLGFFSTDLAIDLGTANTLVFVRDKGIVLNEPSIIAVRRADRAVIGVGREAKAMLGRTPDNILAIRPLKDGVIADFDITQKMLRYFISTARRGSSGRRLGSRLERPRGVVGGPPGVTPGEKRAVGDAGVPAPPRGGDPVEEPPAAPLPGGLPAHQKGRDLVDGVPKTIVVTDEEIREALREPVMTIVETVRTCLERTPPELAADIVETGVVLTGGGALLRGLDRLLQNLTQLPVRVAEDPLTCAVRGAGKALDDLPLLRKVAIPA